MWSGSWTLPKAPVPMAPMIACTVPRLMSRISGSTTGGGVGQHLSGLGVHQHVGHEDLEDLHIAAWRGRQDHPPEVRHVVLRRGVVAPADQPDKLHRLVLVHTDDWSASESAHHGVHGTKDRARTGAASGTLGSGHCDPDGQAGTSGAPLDRRSLLWLYRRSSSRESRGTSYVLSASFGTAPPPDV